MTAILPRIAWGGMAGTVIIAGIFMLQFQLQSEAHKAWVVKTLTRFYRESGTAPPPHLVMRGRDGAPQFGESLISLLKEKRAEFFEQASEEGGWPGNLYVMHQFRGSLKKGANERRKKQVASRLSGNFTTRITTEKIVYLVCTWQRLIIC